MGQPLTHGDHTLGEEATVTNTDPFADLIDQVNSDPTFKIREPQAPPTPVAEPAPESPYVQLRHVLKQLTVDERWLVVEGLPSAILRGVAQAVPLKRQTFTARWTRPKGAPVRRTLGDYVIANTPEFQAWVSEQAATSRYAILAARGRVVTTLERLNTQRDDFDKMAAAHVMELKRRAKRGR